MPIFKVRTMLLSLLQGEIRKEEKEESSFAVFARGGRGQCH